MESRVFPPVDGSVTLPETVDFHNKHNPNTPVYVFAEDGKSEATSITYLEFGRAADRVAHHVRPGRNGPSREVVAFVALSDTLLYQAVTIGLLRAGLVPYPMSPRNTGAAIFKLMKDTSCHRLITTQETLKPLIDDVKSQILSSDPDYELSIEEVPPLHEIFPKLGKEVSEDPFVPYPQGIRPPLDDVMMYLHSSGSTGLPKTITQTFRSMVQWASFPPVMENRKPGLKMAGMALPAFHTLGIIVQILVGHFAMQPVGLYPPIATTPKSLPMMPSPSNILDHTIRSGCNGLVIIPALLQIWAQDKASISVLADLEYVAYSGGSVPSKLGNLLTESGVYLTPVYGGTEFGAPSRYFRTESDAKDWEYVAFSDLVSIRWNSQGDGTFELQYLTTDKHCLSVENLPDVKGYASSDLWVPHPTKPYFWKIVGRMDDVIVHASGEKTVPAPMEDILMSSPYIMGTLMFGREKDQAGVLVELKPPFAINPKIEQDLINARNLLWPIVEEANKVAPGFSRIFKEMILITSPDKPLPRAGKGTVMRKAALLAYADEIEAIYGEVNAIAENVVDPPSSWDLESTISWLQEQIEDIHGPVSIHDDIFDQGMDSLDVTILRRRIVSAMKSEQTIKAAQLVSQTTIYDHSSIEKLAAFLTGIIADPDTFVLTSNRTDAMELMINKYSVGLSEPIQSTSAARQPSDGAVVLLTGTTGYLGAQILESLLKDPRVRTVYTLNRPSSSKSVIDRQFERFVDKGLDCSLLKSPRLVSLEGEASHRNLGLDSVIYDQLRDTVTTIIHSAWRLDFNLSLSSFEPNVQGTRNLIDLARSSAHVSSIKFLFTSSISSASSWDKSQGLYPEEVVSDTRYAVGNGYGESKYVAERILAQSGIQATSIRIGQITGGSPNGAWATSDWVPILVKSSISMGAFPNSAGVSSWLPIHAVSQAILDVNWSTDPSPKALNLVHPRPTPLNSIMSAINNALVSEGIVSSKIPVIDYRQWLSALERHSTESSQDIVKEIPAIKILDFFRVIANLDDAHPTQDVENAESGGFAGFSMNKLLSISKLVETLPSISQEDASMWIKYWKKVEFL